MRFSRKLLVLLIGLLPIGVQAQKADHSASMLLYHLDMNAHHPKPPAWQGSTRSYHELDSLIAAGTDIAENTRERGVAYLKHGDYDRAVYYYERACQLDPKANGYTGWVYLDYMRDYERAIQHLDAYSAHMKNPNVQEGDNPVLFLKGRAYSRLGNYPKALEYYTAAISRIEKSVGSEWVNYLFYIARGVVYSKTHQAALALADFESAVKNAPKSAMAHYHRGQALQQLGRLANAQESYRDALFFLKAEPVERDVYFEHYDAVYEPEIEAALDQLKPQKR